MAAARNPPGAIKGVAPPIAPPAAAFELLPFPLLLDEDVVFEEDEVAPACVALGATPPIGALTICITVEPLAVPGFSENWKNPRKKDCSASTRGSIERNPKMAAFTTGI